MNKNLATRLNNCSSKKWLNYFIFFILIVVLYGQTIFYGFNIDDYLVSTNIPGRVEGLKGILHIFLQRYNVNDYRPVVILTYSMEKWLFGDIIPGISHGVNCFLYWICILSTFTVLTTILNRSSLPQYFTTMVILFFIVHPVHTEVVASLKNRDNLLSYIFTMLTIKSAIVYLENNYKWKDIVLGMFYFMVALFSKLDAIGVIVFVPFLFLLIENSHKKRKPIFIYTIMLIMVFVILRSILIDILAPIHVNDISGIKITSFTENPISVNFNIPNRISAAILTFWYYVKLVVIPWGYRYYYGYNVVKLHDITSWQTLVGTFSIIVICIAIWKYRHNNKVATIGCLGFVSFILYALNFITPVAGIIADRYVFISSLFYCVLLTYGLFKIIKNQNKFIISVVLLLFIFTIISYNRTQEWKNKLSLIKADAPYLHNSYEAMRIASSTFITYSDSTTDSTTKKALLNEAISCANYGNIVYSNNALLNKILANAYFKSNQFTKAKEAFYIALKNDSTDAESYNFIGDIFYIEKNSDSSLFYYKKALKLTPQDPTIINNISSLLYTQGNKKACIEFNEQTIKLQDAAYAAWENLGYYYLQEKDTLKADYYFENSFNRHLKNNEIAEILHLYFLRKKQMDKAEFYKLHYLN